MIRLFAPAIRPSSLLLHINRQSLIGVRSPVFARCLKTSTVDWKPIKSSSGGKRELTFGRGIFLCLIILMPIISFCLGTWQLRRLKWKNDLIAISEDRLTYKPIPFPKNFNPADAEDFQYRKVLVTGKFDHSKELFVGPKLRNEMKGYQLFTPLIRSDGGEPVLIERGFIADDKVLPTRRSLTHLSLPEQEVTVECIIKKINPKANLTWDKLDPDSRLWHVLNVDEMTEAAGCLDVHLQALKDLKDHPVEKKVIKSAPWWKFWNKQEKIEYISKTLKPSEEPSEFNEYQLVKAGVPIGRLPSIDFRNNHMQYLITWYGLSFCSSILLFLVLKKKPKDALSEKLKHAKKFT